MKIIFLLLFSACSMIPEMKKDPLPVPDELSKEGGVKTSTEENLRPPTWRDFYPDKKLQHLIALALENNRDLRATVLTVEELRARYQIQKSKLFPDVSTGASLNVRRIPENAFFTPGGGLGGVGASARESFTLRQYALEVGITSYELDLFGRVRSLNEAALQNFFASDAGRLSAQSMLVSEVASAYLRLLTYRNLKDLAQKTVTSQLESVNVVTSRMRAGVSSALELHQAETLLESARRDSVLFFRQVALAQNDLQLLAGRPLSNKELEGSLTEVMDQLNSPTINLKSTSLLWRPDIRQAEHLLYGANASIGAARAAFFPSLSLTTSIGKLSTEVSTLFDADSNTWAFVPQIKIPIFTGGRLKANLNLAEVRKDRYIAEYEGSIQNAFREVSDALVSHSKLNDVLKVQRKVVASANKAYEVSRARYRGGIENYLVELDSQRALYQAQRDLINYQEQFSSNLTYLYRALGGGVE